MALHLSTKLELMRGLLLGMELRDLLENLSPLELLAAHRFIWEKTLEIGIRMHGKKFPQDELQAKVKELAKVRISQSCPANVKNCNLRDCHERYPECMQSLAIEQIIAMGAATKEYLRG